MLVPIFRYVLDENFEMIIREALRYITSHS